MNTLLRASVVDREDEGDSKPNRVTSWTTLSRFLAAFLSLSCVTTGISLVPEAGDKVVSFQSLLEASKSEASTFQGLRITIWPGPRNPHPESDQRDLSLHQTSVVVQERPDLRGERGPSLWAVEWKGSLEGPGLSRSYVLRFLFGSYYDTDEPQRLEVKDVRQLTLESSQTGLHSLGDLPAQMSRLEGWSPGWVPGDRFVVKVPKSSVSFWGPLLDQLPLTQWLSRLGQGVWIGSPPSRFEVEIDGRTAAELQPGVILWKGPWTDDERVLEEALVLAVIGVTTDRLDSVGH